MEESGEMASASREDGLGDNGDRLESGSPLHDMVSKVQLLQSLSIFLSSAARTMSFSTEVNALSAWVGASAVFLGHKEIAQLHELVVRELKDQTYFLSALSWVCNRHSFEGSSEEGNFTMVLNLKAVSQTLRCCIRILPLMDCFDKNASLASTKLLDGILQQLCHPTKLFHLLGWKALEEGYQTAQGDEDGTYVENTDEAWMANVIGMDLQHRKELIFAILEVFLDEVLLHPDLIVRLLRSREETCRSLAQEHMTCLVKQTEALLEAAFVHVLSSLCSAAFRQVLPGSTRTEFLVGNLGLPAGLILLERFSNEEFPPFHVTHIVQLLARILNDTTIPVGFDQVDALRTRPTVVENCWAGGVDWSYCGQELLPIFDLKNSHCLAESPPSETTLHFASSILEQAILLYSGTSLASDSCAAAVSLSSGALDTESDCSHEDGKGTIEFAGFHYVERRDNMVFDEEEVKDRSGLVVALLQLMSCAVKCIGREVRVSTWLTNVSSDQASSECDEPDFDKILQCVGLYLSLCFPPDTDLFSMYHEQPCGRAGQDEGDSNTAVSGRGALKTMVGQAILSFTKILRSEACTGAPQEILEEYFHLVESLVALLLALDERNNNRKSTPECSLISDCTPCDDVCITSLEVSGCGKCRRCFPSENDMQQLSKFDSTSTYLEEMVLSLRGLLQDLSEQQRQMPEFFLFFMLKQLSTRDVLSLVAVAFSSCLHNHSGLLQTITGRTELFQTEGLVTEVLQVALSEPTELCSIFTFIVYIVDILQDHSPITAALSTSEIAEEISWFETLAYILTLASQLVVCDRGMFTKNGKEFFISFISKACQGIDRMFTEGIAAAQWVCHHCKATEEAWHKYAGPSKALGTSTVTGRDFSGEVWNMIGSLGECHNFLEQVDMLRNAVEELASTVDSSLDCELTALLEKGWNFFVVMSELQTEQKLAESRWSLYLSEQTQKLFLDAKPDSHLADNTLAVGDDHTDGHQMELAERGVDKIQECQETLGSDEALVGNQTLQTVKVSGSEELSTPIESHLPGEEDGIIAQLNSTITFILPSTGVTVEKRRTRSVTALIEQKLLAQDDGLGSEKRQATPQGRRHCSVSTSTIIKRLLRKASPSRRKSTSSNQICNKKYLAFTDDVPDGDVPPSTSSNPFVEFLQKQDHSIDSYDDLKDFIVTKKERDYSVWLTRRRKVRRRLNSKNLFKRLQEKRELLLLLDM
ncbi:unnamed protein product [Calypogeia fissa]